MKTILVTDGTYKQTTGLVRDIVNHHPDFRIYIHVERDKDIKQVFRSPSVLPISGELFNVLSDNNFDLIIPVGAKNVSKIAKSNYRNKAILPKPELLTWAFDKRGLGLALSTIGIAYPRTALLSEFPMTNWGRTTRFVVKPRDESAAKTNPIYFDTTEEVLNWRLRSDAVVDANELIIQECVTGIPIGYFAFVEDGLVKCEFMHRRLRQMPPSGGASSCAETYNDAALSEIGQTFARELKWSGPLMLEFLYDNIAKEYILIEVNPKYWGSLQLAIAAGAHFGHAHVCSFFNIDFVDNQEKKYVRMLWPLDGDFDHIIQTRNFSAITDYTRKFSKITWGNNTISIIYKLIILFTKNLRK